MTSGDLIESPPFRAVESGRVRYGRYRHPIPRPNITARSRFRLKEWHYTSLTTERLFLAFGLVQLGYVANAFCYLVDRRQGARRWEYEAMSPLGWGLRFAPSSVLGTTRLELGKARVEVGWDQGWEVSLDLPLEGEKLEACFRVEPRESLAVLQELSSGQPAYTHKAAALTAAGTIRWRGERHRFDDGLAGLDWTRSVALRETRWKWASMSTRLDDGRPVGLNLSAEVYDDEQGCSRENALWVGGRVLPLGGVAFELPRYPAREPWVIRSLPASRGEVELTFRPLGARSQRVDFKLIRSDFIQPYGLFSGQIRPAGAPTSGAIHLDEAFGVVEDHLSIW